MRMNRRTLLATGATALAMPRLARAQQTFSLKASTYVPPQHQLVKEFQRWADDLRQMTDGTLDVEVFPAGQMGPGPRQYDLARTGVADIAHVYTAFNPGRFPRTDILSLPFEMAVEDGSPIATADASWLSTSLKDTFAPDYAGTEMLYNITIVATGFFMRDVLVASPDDVKGLRIRPTTSLVADQLVAFGASPATVGPAELADAIAKGVVDGAVFNFEGGKAFQLQQSVRKVSMMANAAATFSIVINQDTMDGLPAELQKVIRDTTGPDAARRVGQLYDDAEAEGRALFEQAGVEVTELYGDRNAPFRAAAEPVAAAQKQAISDKGIDVQAVLDEIERLKADL